MKKIILIALALFLHWQNQQLNAQDEPPKPKEPKNVKNNIYINGKVWTNEDDEDDKNESQKSKKNVVAKKEFRFSTKAKKVKVINLPGKIEIDTHNKNEILIIGENFVETDLPADAQGLKRVNISSGEDNTGLSLNISEENDIAYIKKAGKEWENSRATYKILIPEKAHLSVSQKTYNSKSLVIKNVKQEIDVKSSYTSVTLENVSGPLLLNVTYSKSKVIFDKLSQEKPSSIIGAYSTVDVTLPSDTKSNLKLESDYGNIYTDFDFENQKKSNDDEDNVWCAGCKNNIEAKINSGGVELYIKSPYGNIYLRKKK